MPLISKDESIKASMVHIGYIVLKHIGQAGAERVSLTEITSALKKKGITEYRPIMFALYFLHMSGAIDFEAPYIYPLKPDVETPQASL